nr:unnamed protein product [Spirometra erinaceieuropaei]
MKHTKPPDDGSWQLKTCAYDGGSNTNPTATSDVPMATRPLDLDSASLNTDKFAELEESRHRRHRPYHPSLLLFFLHCHNDGRFGVCRPRLHQAEPSITTGTSPATSIIRREGQDCMCPHCDRTSTSHIGLVGHLRIHRTETGEPVPGAPTYTHRTRLYCPHCPRTFTHRMGLFGHMRIHESGIDHNSDTATTSNTSSTPRPILAPPSHAPTTTNATASSTADTDTAGLSCPHCPRTFTSRIGLVGHLRVHRTETGEPVPEAPTYTHRTRLHCPHCPRTFTHRMGLFGHMRIHDDLR